MTDLVYLYGFVPAETRLPDEGLQGIAGSTVELLPLEGVAAAVSAVPARDYAAEAIEPRLGDIPWVAQQGVAHERVVAWFVDHAQILPAALFTLYSSDAALRAEAGPRAGELRGVLERYAGLREWDLKVSYAAERLARHLGEVSPVVEELDARIAAASPGTRFLLERKRAELVRTEASATARRLAAELLDEARRDAERVIELPLAQAAGELPVVLNAALLVRAGVEARLRERVRGRAAELDRVGVAVVFSGPWAPYRFLAEERPA